MKKSFSYLSFLSLCATVIILSSGIYAHAKSYIIGLGTAKYLITVPDNYTLQTPLGGNHEESDGLASSYTFHDFNSKPISNFSFVFVKCRTPNIKLVMENMAKTLGGENLKLEKIAENHYTIVNKSPLGYLASDYIDEGEFNIEFHWDYKKETIMRSIINSMERIQQ